MSKSKSRRLKPSQEVYLFDAKPNPLFPDWLTERLLFLRYMKSVKCAYCGRMSRHHWTLLLAFRIAEIFEKKVADKLVETTSPVGGKTHSQLFPPLTPVCRKHIMRPDV